MNGRPRYYRHVALVVVLCLTAGLVSIPIAQADDDRNPRVFPRDSSPYGNTYGEWTARWWQWLLSIPKDTNPNLDATGKDCDEGQAGPVWFLAGSFGGSFTRSCTVPAGKALLVPVLNTLFGAGAFDCEPTVPGVLCNLNTLRQSAEANQDDPPTLEVKVDGARVENLRDFRVQSPAMILTYPEGNVISFLFGTDVPAGTYTPNVTDGYWLILAPLSRGKHTIRVKGATAGGFVGEGTFHLTIEK